MGRVPWSTLIWPGLPQLWRHGSWSGLGQAVGFAVLLNLVLLATYGWTEWISPGVRVVGWLGIGGWWLAAIVGTIRQKRTALQTAAETRDLFPDAQREYLKGNWYQSELLLVQMLHQEPRDVDARLMLATLLRHTGRTAESTEQMRRLEKTEGCQKWHLEIQREWHRLTNAKESEQLENSPEAAESAGEVTSKTETATNETTTTEIVAEQSPPASDDVSHAA